MLVASEVTIGASTAREKSTTPFHWARGQHAAESRVVVPRRASSDSGKKVELAQVPLTRT